MLVKKTILLRNSFFLMAGLFLFSCGSESTQQEATDSSVTVDTTVSADDEANAYILPSPLQIASIFKKSGLKYYDGITSQQKDPSKYTSKVSQSINLGIYNADLAYCVLNHQTQEALNYMKIARQISNQLGMGSIFDASSLGKRFEKNIGNKDSLTYIIADLQMESDIYLEENQQKYIGALAFTGAWAESMYLGAEVNSKGKGGNLSNKIVEQMTILNKLINILKSFESKDPGINSITTELNKIQELYVSFPSVKNNANSPDEEPSEIILTSENVKSLSALIIEVRTKFIKG